MHTVGSLAGWWFDDRQHRSNKWCDESKGVNPTTFESSRTNADPQGAAAVCGCEERAPVATTAVLLSRRACRLADDWGWGSRPRPRTTCRVVTFIREIRSGLTLSHPTTFSCRASPSTSKSHKVLAPFARRLHSDPCALICARARSRRGPSLLGPYGRESRRLGGGGGPRRVAVWRPDV